jgi:hypothetical protein
MFCVTSSRGELFLDLLPSILSDIRHANCTTASLSSRNLYLFIFILLYFYLFYFPDRNWLLILLKERDLSHLIYLLSLLSLPAKRINKHTLVSQVFTLLFLLSTLFSATSSSGCAGLLSLDTTVDGGIVMGRGEGKVDVVLAV